VSTADLKATFWFYRGLDGQMKAWVERYPTGIVVHAAAVGDYAVPDADESVKVPSGEEGLSLELKPTPKILNAIRGWSESVGIISFKAAGPNTSRADLEAMAKAQAARSDSSIILGNTIGALEAEVLILDRGHLEWFASRPLGMAALVEKIRAMVG
jgi:phosphopantothenoylcysteine decarboxylase/phosphopantothenate--cysteine ligase